MDSLQVYVKIAQLQMVHLDKAHCLSNLMAEVS